MDENEKNERAEFADKVDAFAATLSPNEQAMLTMLVAGADDEVSGFSTGWPGLRGIAPSFIDVATDGSDFNSTAGGSPNVLYKDHTGFQSEAGGSPNA